MATEPPRGVAAIVLAAGAGARMGEPKALLRWAGRTFLRRVVDLAEAAGCAPILAIAGAVRLPAAERGPALEVVHPSWREGQLSSLQAGLCALGGARAALTLDGARAALVLTVDRPHLRPATVAALVAAHAADPAAIWQPVHAGRRGHPILYPADLHPELLALAPAAGPRAWLESPSVAARRRVLPVDDPAVLDNIDTPQDLARLWREQAHIDPPS